MHKRLVLLLFSGFILWTSAAAQTDVSRFLGYWHTGESSIRIKFSLDKRGRLTLKGSDYKGTMKISGLTVTETGTVTTREYYQPTRYTTFNEYSLEEDGRLKNVIIDKKGERSTIYYTKSDSEN